MRILFLDFDGVVNRYIRGSLHHDESWEDEIIARINRLTEQFELEIVVTSDWRRAYSLETLQQICSDYMGLTADVVGVTSEDLLDDDFFDREIRERGAVSRLRALQIQQYIDRHGVEEYIVIDDNRYAEYGHEDVFVRCGSYVGFDEHCLQRATEICESF